MNRNMARQSWMPEYDVPLTRRERIRIVAGSLFLTAFFFGLMFALSVVR